MNSDGFNLKQEEDGQLFSMISFEIPGKNIEICLSSLAKDLIRFCDIPADNIIDIHIVKSVNKLEEKAKVEVKYCKYDHRKLKSLKKEEQIRLAFQILGYSENQIINVSYRKFYSNSNETFWVAVLEDPEHDFDPDEYLSARDYETNLQNNLQELLGFPVKIQFI